MTKNERKTYHGLSRTDTKTITKNERKTNHELSRTDTKMQRKFNFISAILFDREFYFCDKKLEIILSIAS